MYLIGSWQLRNSNATWLPRSGCAAPTNPASSSSSSPPAFNYPRSSNPAPPGNLPEAQDSKAVALPSLPSSPRGSPEVRCLTKNPTPPHDPWEGGFDRLTVLLLRVIYSGPRFRGSSRGRISDRWCGSSFGFARCSPFRFRWIVESDLSCCRSVFVRVICSI
jgi:hypothetical protein